MPNDQIDLSQVQWDDKPDNVIDPGAVQWDNPVADRLESMHKAVSIEPDVAARYDKLSKELGVPFEVAKTNPAGTEKAIKSPAWRQFAENAPKVSQKLAEDPVLFQQAHDDAQALQDIEKFRAELKARGLPELRNNYGHTFNDILEVNNLTGAGTIENTANPASGAMTNVKAVGTQFAESMRQWKMGKERWIRDAADSLGISIGDAGENWAYNRSHDRKYRDSVTTSDAAAPDFSNTVMPATNRFMFGGVSSFAQTAPTMAAGIMNPALGLALGSDQTASQAYAKYRSRGATKAEANVGALSEGSIEYITEKNPIGFAAKNVGKMTTKDFVKGFLGREMLGEQAATFFQDLTDTLVANPDKTMMDFWKERPEAFVQTMFAVGTTSAAMGGLQLAANRYSGYHASQDVASDIGQERKLVKKSMLAARNVAAAREVLDRLDGDDVQEVFIDPKQLFEQGAVTRADFEAAVPSAATQLDEALDKGGLIRVPRNELLLGLKDNDPAWQAVSQHLKVDPSQDTLYEASQAQEQLTQEMTALADKYIAEAKNADDLRGQWDTINKMAKDRLAASGLDPKGVEHAAALDTAVVMANAARAGMNPVDLFNEQMGKVTRQLAGGEMAGTLNQGGGIESVRQAWQDSGIDGQVFENGDVITLSKIVVPEGNRGAGVGTKAMQRLVDYADANGKHVVLSPSPDFGGNVKRLKKFYKGFGFVENKGKNRAFSTRESMYRQAQGKVLFQGGGRSNFVYFQNEVAPRGAFNPETRAIMLLPKADLSTYLHESGHLYLEMMADLAARESASEGLRNDMDVVMRWFGINGENAQERLSAWKSMTLEEKRKNHEKWAESFEQYLFEGKAPSIELRDAFRNFRAWMTQVYKSLMKFMFDNKNAKLNDEMRGVFDRMLATEQQIQEMEQLRGMVPLFYQKPPGATDAEWQEMQKAAAEAPAAAIEMMTARRLRDMKWLSGAKSKRLKAMQREAAALRREARMEAKRQVLSQNIYRAWQFLTAPVEGAKAASQKAKQSESVDPSRDSLLTAIAKLGGLSKDQAVSQWGIDPADYLRKGGVFGKPVLRVEGGLSPDAMAEALSQHGYMPLDENGKWDIQDLDDMLRAEAAGDAVYSNQADYDLLLGEPPRMAVPDAESVDFVGARLNRNDLIEMYGYSDPDVQWSNPLPAGALNQGGDQTQTPAFKKWFGDSKVVDENGNPMVVYHGTDAPRTVFDRKHLGRSSGRGTGTDWGFFFAKDKDHAEYWANNAGGERVVESVYLRIENPLVIEDSGNDGGGTLERILDERLQDSDHDGAIIHGMRDDDSGELRTAYLVFDSEQIKSAIGNRGTFDPENPNILFQPAFHGSPYKFDKFSLDHMGKGEGAQAYGYGLYFAGSKEVAEYYRKALTVEERYVNGELLDTYKPDHLLASVLSDESGNVEDARDSLAVMAQRGGSASIKSVAQEALKLLEEGARPEVSHIKPDGQLYKVEIPEDDTYLLWDKPLSEQPENVREAVGDAWASAARDIGVDISEMTGGQFYTSNFHAAVGYMPANSPQMESRWLNKLGINGIKYLDGSSRGAGEGSYNYVIFDDSAIQILETYYQTGDDKKESGRSLESMKMVSDDGLHPDTVADLFGLSSGDELVRKLLTLPDPVKEIERLTDEIMLQRHSELASPEAMEQAVSEAVHNEARMRLLATEMAVLNRAAGKPRMIMNAAKIYAERIIGQTRIRDLRPAQYEAQESKAAQETVKELAAGNTRGAAMSKRNQILHSMTAKMVREAQDEVEKAVKYLKKFDKPNKKIDIDYQEQIDTLLERYDFRQKSLKAIDRSKTLAAWMEEQRALGLEPVIPDYLLDEAKRTHYKDLTIEEMRGLVDAVKNIEHLGRLKNRLLTDKARRELNAIGDEIAQSIGDNNGTKAPKLESNTAFDRAWKLADGFASMHRKLASIARQLDGWKDGGPMWQYLIRSMNEAGDNEAVMREQATMALAEVFAPLKGKKLTSKLYIPMIADSLSYEGRLSVALNWGNESNRQRLLDGNKWGVGEVNAILATLTADDWKFVQGVWDHMESYRDAISTQQKRLTGVDPDWIPAAPFEVKTADGQTLTIRGGYYPAKYDTDHSVQALSNEAASNIMDQWKAAKGSGKTKDGFTKSRAAAVKDRPLRKDLGVITQRVTEVTHRLAWQDWIVDANRLLRLPQVEQAIMAVSGDTSIIQEIRKGIEDIAAGDAPAQNTFETAINHLRVGTTIAGLGWNLTTSLLQPFGLTQSMVRIGPKWVAKGLATWIGSPARMKERIEWVYSKSEFMRLRGKTMMREMSEILNSVRRGKMSKIEATYFYAIQIMQIVADMPTWLGAYEKAMVYGDEALAIALADQAVLDAQGGGQVKDLSRIQRGGPLMKLWTNFYSYFNTTYNLSREVAGRTDWRDPVSVGHAMVDYLLLYTVPSVMVSIMKGALIGDDDEDELADRIVRDQLSYLFGSMVGLREIAAAFSGFQGYSGPAGTRFFSEFARLGKQIEQGDADEAFWKALNNTGGILFHYPAGQINRTVTGADALMSGETDNPSAVVFGVQK